MGRERAEAGGRGSRTQGKRGGESLALCVWDVCMLVCLSLCVTFLQNMQISVALT